VSDELWVMPQKPITQLKTQNSKLKTTMEQRFEMIWDCRYCGNKKMLARTHRHCATCGAPQDPTWRYFPSEEEAVAVLDNTLEGADVICPSCKSPNAKSADFCRNCATPLTEAASVRTFGEQSRNDGQSFVQEDLKARRDAEKLAARGETAPTRANKGNWTWLIGVVVLLVAGVWWLTQTREATVGVVGHSWQREIRIEQFAPVPASAWCESVPIGAYNVRQYRDVRSTRQVADGQTCRTVRRDNGDGTYSQRRECRTKYRSEPIYGNRCDFVVNTWRYSRSATSNGANLETPVVWAVTNLKTGNVLGSEREAGRSEKYTLQFAGNNVKPFSCDVPETQWRGSSVGAVFGLKVGQALGNAQCDTLTTK
jgi:hypothetical protein